MNNPILDELHAARQKLLADAGGDIHRYVEEARERTKASGRVIAERTPRGHRKRIGELIEAGVGNPEQLMGDDDET